MIYSGLYFRSGQAVAGCNTVCLSYVRWAANSEIAAYWQIWYGCIQHSPSFQGLNWEPSILYLSKVPQKFVALCGDWNAWQLDQDKEGCCPQAVATAYEKIENRFELVQDDVLRTVKRAAELDRIRENFD